MPPEAVVEEGLPAVEKYLTEVQTAQEVGARVTTVQLLKVVLVGSSQAGKTRCLQAQSVELTVEISDMRKPTRKPNLVSVRASTLAWQAR